MRALRRNTLRLVLALAATLTFTVATAQGTCQNLTFMTWAHFIQASDTDLQSVLDDFGQQHGVDVRLDLVALNDLPAKLAAAVQSQSGPDVVLLMNYSTALFDDQLIPVDDVVAQVEQVYSPFWEIGAEASKIQGTWKSVPWFYTPAPANVRKDYFDAAGQTPPDTWAELLAVSGPMNQAGHPVGLPISNAGDSNDWLLQMMASYGAHPIDADGNVAIDSAATRQALDFVRQLAANMPRDVLGWDGGGNNQLILSGLGSWTINPVSVYVAAKADLPMVAENLIHTLPPAGPEGRFATTSVYTLGVTKWSPCQDLAKQLLVDLYQPPNFEGWITASGGYNVPMFQDFPTLDVWSSDPKMGVPQEMGQFMHLALWPAPPTMGAALQEIYNTYLIPTMFSKAVNGESNDAVVQWASDQLTEILSR